MITINEEELTFASDGHMETIKDLVYSENGELLGVLDIGRASRKG